MTAAPSIAEFPHAHLLGIEGLSPGEITLLLDLANGYVALNRRADKKTAVLARAHPDQPVLRKLDAHAHLVRAGRQALGADVINMSVADSAIKKGETLIDTAMTLNAMHPDVLVVRHPESGVKLLSEKVNCAVINAGRWQPRAPDAGAAGRADDPPPARRHRGADRGDLW